MRLPKFALTLLALGMVAADGTDGQGNRIRGIWAAQSIMIDGIKKPDDPTAGTTMIAFDGKTYVQREGSKIVEEGDYLLTAGDDPGTIDLSITKGEYAGQTQLGIYRLSGETLTICASAPGAKSRPKDFNTKPGSGKALVVFRRFRP